MLFRSIKTVQFLRNQDVISSYEAAVATLQGKWAELSDGSPIVIRYTEEEGEGEDLKVVSKALFAIKDNNSEVDTPFVILDSNAQIEALEAKLAALEETIAEELGENGSVAEAIAKLKEELLGDATDGYKSLGDVEDKIKAVAEAAKSYSMVAIAEEKFEELGLGANVKEAFQLVDEDGAQAGEIIKVYKDSALKEVALDEQELKFTYILADGSESTVGVDVSKFLAESEFGDGLEVVDGIVKVKVDAASEAFLSVSENGVKVSGVADAIASAITQAIESASAYTDGKVTELTNAIASAKTEAIETASAYTDGKVTELTNAIASAKTEANNYTDEKFTSASTALNDAISGVTDAFEQADAALLSSITENAEAIEAIDVKLSGVTSVSGAIEAAKTEVKGYTDTQITNAINALDSTVTNGEDATVQVSIEQVDGKVNSVSADLYWGSF